MSPSGSAAALWFGADLHVEAITGLPDSPSIREIDLAFMGGTPSALAISDDGQWVVASWNQLTYAFGPAGQAILLPVSGAGTALAFYHQQLNLVAATATQVMVVTDIGGAAHPAILLDNGEIG